MFQLLVEKAVFQKQKRQKEIEKQRQRYCPADKLVGALRKKCKSWKNGKKKTIKKKKPNY